MIKYLITIIILMNYAHASWLCKDASSQAQGDVFYACGHAIEDSLTKSREAALDAAKREFNAFCNESVNCKNNAYTISPMRTDCNEENGKFSCYRGLQYTISQQKRSEIFVDKDKLAKMIREKEKELESLEEDLSQIHKLDELNAQIEKVNRLDTQEAQLEYLKHQNSYSTKAKIQSIAIKIGGASIDLKKDNTADAENIALGVLGAEYQYQLWKNISLRFSLSYLIGSSDDEVAQRGTANTSSIEKFHSHRGLESMVGASLQFGKFYINPSIGFMGITYESTQYQYNAFGVGTNKVQKDYKFNSGFASIGVRYGKELFVELDVKKYFKDSKNGAALIFGMQVEF